MATVFKHVNKSIICETVSMYQSQCIAVSGGKGRGRKVLKFLIQALWDVLLFQVVTGGFLQENSAYIFRIEQERIMV